MKTKVTKRIPENTITIHRYQKEALENQLLKEHETTLKEVAIDLGKDLASLNKPEPDKKEDHYSDPIYSAYRKMGITAKKELQVDIESHNIISDKEEADRELEDLASQLNEKENALRLKKRELEKEDNTLLKKDKRYKLLRWFFSLYHFSRPVFKRQSTPGNAIFFAYLLCGGTGIGIGIFLISEFLPEIIKKGRTPLFRFLIGLGCFSILAILFYVLGVFRTLGLNASTFSNQEGLRPIYFVCLNLFFVMVSTLVVWFNKLTKEERRQLDSWKQKKEEVDTLTREVTTLKSEMHTIRVQNAEAELSRKQLLLYAKDIQELIQSYYEQSIKTFYSTNLIHRSDGKTPICFSNPIPKLPIFYTNLKLN